MSRLVVAICAVAGLVMPGSDIANAAAPSSVAEHQIRIPVEEDPDLSTLTANFTRARACFLVARSVRLWPKIGSV
jgi:hypothetical protein